MIKIRFFLDTEFHENGSTIDLISIALVSEDGREYYACNKEFDLKRMTEESDGWLWHNVLPLIPPFASDLWRTRAEIRGDILSFVRYDNTGKELDGQPEFWAYFADYDWIVFCQLFGRMKDVPIDFPMFCFDLKQWYEQLGRPAIPRQISDQHDALEDARWNKQVWESLKRTEEAAKIGEQGENLHRLSIPQE